MAVDFQTSASYLVSDRQALPWYSQRDGDVPRRELYFFGVDTIINNEKPTDHALFYGALA